jgi:hypothetical protein
MFDLSFKDVYHFLFFVFPGDLHFTTLLKRSWSPLHKFPLLTGGAILISTLAVARYLLTQHLFKFFLIVVFPFMLTIIQLLFQQNAHVFYY